MTTRRWAWKQPSFEESVIAHWSSSMAPKMSQGSSDSPKRRDRRIFFDVSVAGRSVNRGRFLVTRPGDIRSENADMSNEKSCEKHDRLPVEGFLRSVNLRRVNRSLRNPRKGCRPMGTRKLRSCFDYRTMPVCWSELDDRAEDFPLFPSLSFP